MGDGSLLSGPKILSVTELVLRLRDTLESEYADVYVEGEITGFSSPASGHYYFTLKDENTQVSAVMFRMQNRLIRFRPENGMLVTARGRASVYPPRGSLQIIVDYLEPQGAGALAAAFEQRKKDLAAKGYFDQERKKPLPELPKVVGIATSPTGAALYDALRIALGRAPNLHVIIAPTMVQGDQAPGQIAQAIENLVADGRSEVILLIRGGGSAEDLWAFNEMPVADAIFNCPIPVVTGVGHEIDFTIADFCADLRAPTPTAAAEMTVPRIADILADVDYAGSRLARALTDRLRRFNEQVNNLEHRLKVRGLPTLLPSQRLDELSGRMRRAQTDRLKRQRERHDELGRRLRSQGLKSALPLEKLNDLTTRLYRATNQKMKHSRQELNSHASRLMASNPARQVATQNEKLEMLTARLGNACSATLSEKRTQLEKAGALLDALSPLHVLKRGYSITRQPDTKRIVRSADQVKKGDELEVLLGEGELGVKVEKK